MSTRTPCTGRASGTRHFLRSLGVGPDMGAFEYDANQLVVSTLVDESDEDYSVGDLSLREAIELANTRPGHETITFSASLDLSAAVDITLGGTEISITSDLTIIGPGADTLTVSANDASRIFNIAAGNDVTISGLTLKDGSGAAGGAVLSTDSRLTLQEVEIIDSTATASGGGLHVTGGSLQLIDSVIADNTASTSTHGGGVYITGAAARILQSTISQNTATGSGGGLYIGSTNQAVEILQSTITENTATANGDGVYITSSGGVLMQNTLIAANDGDTDDVYGAVLASSSYNLVGDGDNLTGVTNGTSGNQIGTASSPIDPKLAALADNGGPTRTHALRLASPALASGSPVSPHSSYYLPSTSATQTYDLLDRVVSSTTGDPDGYGTTAAPVTTSEYDARGSLVAQTDALGNTTTHVYDALGRKTSTTDPESGVTAYTYDVAGRMASLTDPVSNTTDWTYSPLGRKASETINVSSTDLTRTFAYNAAGQLTRKIDRNGRVTDFTYDDLLRRTTEKWYDDVDDTTANLTYTTTYDTAGRVASIGDGATDFDYEYSILGNLTSQTQDLDGLSDDVVFTYEYDVSGRKSSVAAKIGSTDDYVNQYAYDNSGRVTRVTQSGQTGGNSVAEKRLDFGYSDDGRSSTLTRYADLAGTDHVAETDRLFDRLGRLTDITHERADTVFADYDYTWDAAGRLTDFDFTSSTGASGDADYAYDDTNQLTGADYASDWQSDETYAYDANGNRTAHTIGDHNRLTSDGTYYYTYDNEGNQTGKYSDSGHTTPVEKRFWDHRNRLTMVELYVSGSLSKTVEYAYDQQNRMFSRVVAADSTRTIFLHDQSNQIVLDLTDDNTGSVTTADLSARRLWNPTAVDQALAEEHISSGDVYYPLTDHINTVRDVAEYDSATDTTSIVKHVTYDAYGQVLTDTAPSLILLPGYSGKYNDPLTGDNYHLNRWYDLSTGRWRSEDPIGFAGGDGNLYRYAFNRPASISDSIGLVPAEEPPSGIIWVTDEDRKEYTIAGIADDVHGYLKSPGTAKLVDWFPGLQKLVKAIQDATDWAKDLDKKIADLGITYFVLTTDLPDRICYTVFADVVPVTTELPEFYYPIKQGKFEIPKVGGASYDIGLWAKPYFRLKKLSGTLSFERMKGSAFNPLKYLKKPGDGIEGSANLYAYVILEAHGEANAFDWYANIDGQANFQLSVDLNFSTQIYKNGPWLGDQLSLKVGGDIAADLAFYYKMNDGPVKELARLTYGKNFTFGPYLLFPL